MRWHPSYSAPVLRRRCFTRTRARPSVSVINFELPRSPNDYTHRIGRTGRAGTKGVAISLICPDDAHHFGVIEKRIQQRLPREQVPGFEISEAAGPRR